MNATPTADCAHHTKGDGSYWLYDGHGLPLCRACPKCSKEKLSKFRVDILDAYVPDEPLDPE